MADRVSDGHVAGRAITLGQSRPTLFVCLHPQSRPSIASSHKSTSWPPLRAALLAFHVADTSSAISIWMPGGTSFSFGATPNLGDTEGWSSGKTRGEGKAEGQDDDTGNAVLSREL